MQSISNTVSLKFWFLIQMIWKEIVDFDSGDLCLYRIFTSVVYKENSKVKKKQAVSGSSLLNCCDMLI